MLEGWACKVDEEFVDDEGAEIPVVCDVPAGALAAELALDNEVARDCEATAVEEDPWLVTADDRLDA